MFTLATAAIQILLLLYVIISDVKARVIPNTVCLLLAVLAAAHLPFGDFPHLVYLLAVAGSLFVMLLVLYGRGVIGGGDVKLLAALAIGLSFTEVFQFLYVTVLAGAAIALVYSLIRLPPYPSLPPSLSERWRNLLRTQLPYGVAIACGGVWIILSHGV
jgi:Flp pilus assembly protein protease CpaA